jgi:ferrochelatase
VSPKRRIAVVLFNLGGPDSLKAVRPFLFNLFRDKAIITAPAVLRYPLAALIAATRDKPAQANYAMMGGRSPLLPETEAQAQALTERLAGLFPDAEARCFIAMRYWRPFTDETARQVAAFSPDEVVLLPLYPQFSTTTTGSSLQAWAKAYRGTGRVHAVCCYPTVDGLVAAHAQKIEAAYVEAGFPGPTRLLFSAHGLPERTIAAGDPYQAQIEATAQAVAARLGGDWDWKVCYQSRVGRLKWIGPSTPEAIAEAVAEGKGVVIAPIAFVSEHVETLVELDREYAELAHGLGCKSYVRVAALGVQTEFVTALSCLVAGALDRGGGLAPGAAWRCPSSFGGCPYKTGEAA